jgi:hypothetical protein
MVESARDLSRREPYMEFKGMSAWFSSAMLEIRKGADRA